MIYYWQSAKSGSLKQTGGFHSSFHCLEIGRKMQGKHSCSLCKHSQGWLLLRARGNWMLLMPNNWLLAGDSEVALRNRGNLGVSLYLSQGIRKCGKDYASIGEKSLIEWFFPQDLWHYYTNNWQGFADAAVATSVMLEVCRINVVIHTCLYHNLMGQISVSEVAACG